MIEVRYLKTLSNPPPNNGANEFGARVYHKYLVYTTTDHITGLAKQYYLRGGGEGVPPAPFGLLDVHGGRYTAIEPDRQADDIYDVRGQVFDEDSLKYDALATRDHDANLGHFREIIAVDGDLSSYWRKMMSVADIINSRDIQYKIMGPNSNSTVDTLLYYGNLASPTMLSELNNSFAPGSGFDLLGPMVFKQGGWPKLPSDWTNAANPFQGMAASVLEGWKKLESTLNDIIGAANGWAQISTNGTLSYSLGGGPVQTVQSYFTGDLPSAFRVDKQGSYVKLSGVDTELSPIVVTATKNGSGGAVGQFTIGGEKFSFHGPISDFVYSVVQKFSRSGARVTSDNGSGLIQLASIDDYLPPAGYDPIVKPSIGRTASEDVGNRFAANMSGALAATLGTYLAKGDETKGVVYSSLLGELGERLALTLTGGGAFLENALPGAMQGSVGSFGSDVWARIDGAVVGTFSTLLTMELGQALGVEGFGAELFNSVGSTVVNQAFLNVLEPGGLANIWNGLHPSEIFSAAGSGGLMASSIGAFLGAKLGSMVVSPQTQAGVALSSLGATAGALLGAAAYEGVLLASSMAAAMTGGLGAASFSFFAATAWTGIGAFVGFVAFALIGNLFGKKKPKVPTASAETVLQIPYARYELGTITVANNGNRDLVTSMASMARDTLNGLIAMVAYTNTTAYVSNLNGVGTTQVYGHTGGQIYVKINGAQTNFSSADQAVEFGALAAIRNTKIVGGDIFAKRVIAKSPAADLTSLTGDLQVASDYRFYANNRDLVNSFITGAYATLSEAEQSYYAANKALIDKTQTQGTAALTSGELSTYNANKPTIDKIIGALENQALANPWIITLQRVSELGLDKWSSSDFHGGLRGFLSSFDLAGHGVAFENATFLYASGPFGVIVSGGMEGLFAILPSAGADGRSATIDSLGSIGYTWAAIGMTTSGNDFVDYRYTTDPHVIDDNHQKWVESGYQQWNGWDYEWIDTSDWETREGGDDILIGGQGADTLYGRSGWDWLDGQAGDDVLDGGEHNDVLLGSAGRDTLYGGIGDDYLTGGAGNEGGDNLGGGLLGGAGDDTLVGGDGNDSAYGEAGDDTFLYDDDGGAVWDWYDGGAGRDTVSYERRAAATVVDMRYAAGWTWSPTALAVNGDGWLGIENVTGSAFADWLCGDDASNTLKGLAGDDELHGWGGDDFLEGGAGADRLYGWGGFNTASYAGSTAGVYVDLSIGEAFGGDADGDTLDNIKALRGSALADQLKGDGTANRLEGMAGDDWLVATGGADNFDGGEGKDFVDYSEVAAGVSLNLGSYTATAVTGGSGYGGLAAGQIYSSVEGVVGSAYADTLQAGDGDQTFIGGAGSDSLSGGAGADTYVLDRGDGYDTVTEDASGWNTFSFGDSVKFSDLWIGASGGAGGYLDVGFRGASDVIRMVSNFGAYPIAGNNKLKSIDLNGAGQLDVGAMSFAMAGDDNANTLYGGANRADMIFGYNGNDAIYGVQAGQSDQLGDVFVGGLGNDSLSGSGGDDQYAYDRGDGVDTIFDTGGEDTIVFGSTVAADDVIYQVVNGDLYVGLKDADDATRVASAVQSRIRVVNGGTVNSTAGDYSQGYLVEYIIAGGTSIDLRKLNINWTFQIAWNYSHVAPIALDLDGDGLNLSAVESSNVVVKTAQGGLSKLAWVGPTDGFLAVDRDGDGGINRLSEISFLQDKPGATSDLEGLRTWDTNADGVLDKADKDFSKILLFVDANQNGRSTAKELRTLEQAGIVAINLGGTATGYTAGLTTESFVQNTISFVWADGRTGEGYDVALARQVLGSEGLYAGEYQAEWGARDEDGTLGQLLNDPKTAAKAARIQAKRGLLDKLGASYTEVKAAAQLDFSDNDRIVASIADRWKKMDASQRAAWLSGQANGMEGQQNLAGLKAISSDQALRNALDDAAQAGQDLVAQGLAQAGALVSTGASGGETTSGLSGSAGLGVGVADASGLSSGLGNSLASSQPLDGVVVAGGRVGEASAWWRSETDGGLSGAGSLAALLATMDQGVGQPAPGELSAADDPAVLQQQMLLRQAMAGFGGQAGGSAAVWNRDAAQASALLAVSGQTTRPSAFNLALAS